MSDLIRARLGYPQWGTSATKRLDRVLSKAAFVEYVLIGFLNKMSEVFGNDHFQKLLDTNQVAERLAADIVDWPEDE